MVGGRITVYAPIPGVSAGVSGYTGELTERTGASNRQQTYGAFADVTKGPVTVRSEAFRHVLGSASDMLGWYVEGSWRLPGGFQLAARYDRMEMDGVAMGDMDPMDSMDPMSGMDPVDPMGGMDPMSGTDPMDGMGAMASMGSLMEHRELGLGLNYWFSDGLVLKLSYHRVDGNRFAHPLEVGELMQAATANALSPRTSAFVIGAQFAY